MRDIFPPFSQETKDERHLAMFKVARVINAQNTERPKAVVSTSLYWGTHSPHVHKHRPPTLETLQTPSPTVRHGQSWWECYFMPFLKGCSQKLPAGWIQRVYLAADLDFLVEHIPTNVEIHLMALPSWTSMPGMLWRYLPAEETVCIARGADNYELGGGDQLVLPLALYLDTFLVRHVTTEWRDPLQRFIYRSIRGSCTIRGPISFVPSAAAWIASNQQVAPSKKVVAYPHLSHVGFDSRGAYGQDEQFLCRWLYYKALSQRTITLVSEKGDHEVFRKDMVFLQAHSGLHSVIRR